MGPDRLQVLLLLADASSRQSDLCGLHSLRPTTHQPKLGLCTHVHFTLGGKDPGKVCKEGSRMVQNAFLPGEREKGFPGPTPRSFLCQICGVGKPLSKGQILLV